jgi:hypothetical protein
VLARISAVLARMSANASSVRSMKEAKTVSSRSTLSSVVGILKQSMKRGMLMSNERHSGSCSEQKLF